jgi:hypothetical protein
MIKKRVVLIAVAVMAGTLFMWTTVSQAGDNLGQPFQKLNQKFDQLNAQIGEVKEQLAEVEESVNVMPEFVYGGLRSGSKHWVSPYWDEGHTTVTGNYYSDKAASSTSIIVLNGSSLEPAYGKLKLYDMEGNLLTSINFEVGPHAVWTFTNPAAAGTNMGWAEVIADKDVFLDGIIQYITHHFFGRGFQVENTYAESEHSRTMTWYPVKD